MQVGDGLKTHGSSYGAMCFWMIWIRSYLGGHCARLRSLFRQKRTRNGERRSVDLERTLRVHFFEQWYALSDPAVRESVYDPRLFAGCRFVGIELGREPIPNEATVSKFGHLLENLGLTADLLVTASCYLQGHGCVFLRPPTCEG